MLTDGQMKSLHAHEIRTGGFLLPYEIAQRFTIALSIKKHWGIPEATQSQSAHSDRIRVELSRLIRDKKCHVDIGDDESRANFDWHVFHSDIDFAYHAAQRSAVGDVEDVDQIFGKAEES